MLKLPESGMIQMPSGWIGSVGLIKFKIFPETLDKKYT